MIGQYKEKRLRFCKIKKGTKKPFEKDWVNKPYEYKEIEDYILKSNNFGILCGYGGLIVIDADTRKLRDSVEKELPKTFTVKTGSGGTHSYFFCPEVKKKIVLTKEKTHYGEVQAQGTQVVGAGSLHPNGKYYEVLKDFPIQEISQEDLIKCIKPFMKEVQFYEKKAISELKDYGDSDINKLKILDVISPTGFKKSTGGEYFGSNPWHGSDTKANFWINPYKNVAFCFRCDVGINVVKAIALNEGIISSCDDYLDKEQFLEVLKVAQDKYGLKKPDKKEIRKAMGYFDNYLSVADNFVKLQPLYYDRSKLWWLWNFDEFKWEIIDETDLFNKFGGIDTFQNINTTKTMIKNEILESLKRVSRINKPIDGEKVWVQFKDKIIDVENEISITAHPKYFITNPVPWEIGGSEDTPIMDMIFEEWVGKEYVQTLYEILAYSLLPDYPIHRLFCFVGEGLNGKSCFLRLLKKFVGNSNTTATELDDLMGSRFEKTKLHKKLVCIMGETNFNEISKTSLIKKLTGQDLIGFEYKNKNPFDDINYAKILIATNNLPTTTDKTIGFYRRWMIIDFPNKFSEKKDILDSIPEIEYNNLAKKSIKLLKNLITKREFHNEGSIEERERKYEDRSNPFDKFWNDCIIENFSEHISKKDFKIKLDDWCVANRFRKLANVTIAKYMQDKNIIDERVTGEWYEGVGEKPRYWAWVGITWKKIGKEGKEGKSISVNSPLEN